MSELGLMWRNTRMVVLCAISAALYAAVLVPFKVVPLVPGVTDLRPANAIPVVCSFLFGPAAAWGAAIGNMIGDFFGGVSPGDIFGLVGNFVYGYIPYKVWGIIAGDRSPISRAPLSIASYVVVCLLASLFCADIIGFGDNVLALKPFGVLGNLIILNDMLAALVLAPLILAAVYPRVAMGRMLFRDLMPELRARPLAVRALGLAALVVGAVGAWLTGNLVSAGYWLPAFVPRALAHPPYDGAIGIVVGPFIVLALAGLALM